VVTHQLQVERGSGKVRLPETDVLPLCHATNWSSLVIKGVVKGPCMCDVEVCRGMSCFEAVAAGRVYSLVVFLSVISEVAVTGGLAGVFDL